MVAIKPRGNLSTELKMMALLKKEGLKGWRRQFPLAGTPDFCWPQKKVVLFVDGCFWHGCPSCHRTPKSNVSFWNKKIVNNRKRDRRVNRILRKSGWHVIRVWEHQIEGKSKGCPNKVKKRITGI